MSLTNSLKYNTIECRYFPMPTLAEPAEIEIVYINKGEGICFAGDGLVPFRMGDLFIFSGQISHYFKSAKQFYIQQYPLRCGATSIQFGRDILPAQLDSLRECANISTLMMGARRGIKWSSGELDRRVIEQIDNMERLDGFERMVVLYDVLNRLGRGVDRAAPIASELMVSGRQVNNRGYLKSIEYIIRHFDQSITLDDLAAHIDINKSALCRHFKAHAGRSIFDFLLELRINYAKELLASKSMAISEIAVDSGFNNLPNFNVQFKRLVGCTPGEYRIRAAR